MEKKLFKFGLPWEHNISLSQGGSVCGGRWVLLSGQASLDDQGNVVGKGDMELQVRTSLEAVRRALALVGATPADVVKLNVYTTDCRAFHKTQPIREAFFPKPWQGRPAAQVNPAAAWRQGDRNGDRDDVDGAVRGTAIAERERAKSGQSLWPLDALNAKHCAGCPQGG